MAGEGKYTPNTQLTGKYYSCRYNGYTPDSHIADKPASDLVDILQRMDMPRGSGIIVNVDLSGIYK